MTVESQTYIGDPNWFAVDASNNPQGSDTRREGDDHLRLTKGVLKRTFPNFGETTAEAVTPNEQELNTLRGINTGTDLETRLAQIEAALDRIGTIKAWPIQEASLTQTLTGTNAPGTGTWHLCDGTTLDGSTTYSSLYALIANDFGGTDAASMQIPKIEGRVIAGRGTGTELSGYRQGVDDSAQGNTGGEESHTPVIGETAAHDHGGGVHSHNLGYSTGATAGSFASSTKWSNTATGASVGGLSGVVLDITDHIRDSAAVITSEGNDENFNVVQPTIIIAYYIRVL